MHIQIMFILFPEVSEHSVGAWYKFSKVSALVYLLYKATIYRTFEN